MRKARWLLVPAAVVPAAVTLSLTAGTAPAAGSPPVHAVSAGGQVLYEYEALLNETYGPGLVECSGSGGCHMGWFYSKMTGPLSEFSTYSFVFSGFGKSVFHLMPVGVTLAPGSFGNYPVPVTVNGRVVACNPAATEFLVTNGAAVGNGDYSCLKPEF